MKSLRQVIRKLILESDGIDMWNVYMASADEKNKRFMGNYAKKIFAQNADIPFLKSLIYIHTKRFDAIDSFLNSSSKDELSCIFMKKDMWKGVLQAPYAFGDIMGTGRIAFVIEGHPTWVQNKNAATGHTGRLKRKYYDNQDPESGINKAPGKMYGIGLPDHQLDGVIMDADDAEEFGLQDFYDRPNKNNEALIDNWKCTAILRITHHTDREDSITDEYNAKIDEAIEKVKSRWPQAVIIEAEID